MNSGKAMQDAKGQSCYAQPFIYRFRSSISSNLDLDYDLPASEPLTFQGPENQK